MISAAVLALAGGEGPDPEPLLLVESSGGVYAVRASGERERLATGREPALSPDGRRVAFVRGRAVHVLTLSGGRLVRSGVGTSPAWAPDGRLAVAAPDGVRVAGRLVVPGATEPAWATDGRLAVVTAEGIAVDGTLVVPSGRSPAFAPDGRLAYALGADVYVDGQLVVPAAGQPAWGAGGVRVFHGVGRIRFVTDPPHHHWHLMRFQEFELRRASDFAVVELDRKTGFCLRDRHHLAGARGRPHFSENCGQWQTARMSVEMGTSVGYTDLYPAHFHGQSLDVTGVPAGVYVLVHRVNASRGIRELRYDNNAASARIRIAWPRGRRHAPSVRILRVCPSSERC